MNIQNFFNQWDNRFCDFDGQFGPQCKDLINQYTQDVLNLPVIRGNAIDLATNHPGFDFIKNTPINSPKLGDIVVFNMPPYGHACIVQSANIFSFTSLDQNWPLNSPCHIVKHNYKNVVGWLRPIPKGMDKLSPPFTMSYTCINADPNLMEQARKLLNTLSNGKLDCTFSYQQLPPIYSPTELYTQDNQFKFLQAHPVTTPFVFLTFISQTNWVNMVTSKVPGTQTILTAANPNGSALNVAFEFTHAIDKYLQSHGVQIEDTDIYVPDQNFLQKKINLIVENLVLLKS